MYIMMNIRIIKSLLSYTKDMFQSISQTLLNINTLHIVFSYASCVRNYRWGIRHVFGIVQYYLRDFI